MTNIELRSLEAIKVLDKGYVQLVDSLGSDLHIVNAARASYDASSEAGEDGQLAPKDIKLLHYLIKNKHYSPIRQCAITLQLRAPLMVCRQIWKHHIASAFSSEQAGWNEVSARYVTGFNEFYVPENWRSIPENKKQGSGDDLTKQQSNEINANLLEHINNSIELYETAINEYNAAPELARLFLPAYGMYVNFYWTASLQTLFNFIDLRADSHSQWEIQQYAGAIKHIVETLYPQTYEAWRQYNG